MKTRVKQPFSEQEILKVLPTVYISGLAAAVLLTWLVQIFGQICLGIAVLHHASPPVVHRDIKVRPVTQQAIAC